MSRHRHHAFTLVELLVVIAIVALLMALLLPSLNKARATVQKINCQSQLRQMTLALSMYRSDWRDYFPLIFQVESCGFQHSFIYRLRRYLNNNTPGSYDTAVVKRHLFYCPAVSRIYTKADTVPVLQTEAWIDGHAGDQEVGTYNCNSGLGYNANFYYDPSNSSNMWLAAKRDLLLPAKTTVYMDGLFEERVDHSFYSFSAPRHPSGVANGVNEMMADGHIQWLAGTDVQFGAMTCSWTFQLPGDLYDVAAGGWRFAKY